jgi:hypothetical protein
MAPPSRPGLVGIALPASPEAGNPKTSPLTLLLGNACRGWRGSGKFTGITGYARESTETGLQAVRRAFCLLRSASALHKKNWPPESTVSDGRGRVMFI